MDQLDQAPRSDSTIPVRTDAARTHAVAWILAALVLPAGAVWLVGTDDVSLLERLGIALGVLAVVLALRWRWEREQRARRSPWSEYVAVGYSVMFYVALLMDIAEIGPRLVDWLLFMPPVSIAALVARPALMGRAADCRLARRRARYVHLAAAVVFLLAALFLLLTVIAIFVVPVPLIGAGLHGHAARFYQDRVRTPSESSSPKTY